jgi:hypothetical protein
MDRGSRIVVRRCLRSSLAGTRGEVGGVCKWRSFAGHLRIIQMGM